MVNADLATAQAAEIFLSVVGASAVKAIRLLMVDALHFETLVQAIPCAAFVGVNRGALGDASADERGGLALRTEHGGERISPALPFYDNHLAPAFLVAGGGAIDATFLFVGGVAIAAREAAVRF